MRWQLAVDDVQVCPANAVLNTHADFFLARLRRWQIHQLKRRAFNSGGLLQDHRFQACS
jgi:hypothetical protein